MLSGYQVEVVGFHTDNGPICYDCAVKAYCSLTVEKQAIGLGTSVPREELLPIIRYEAGEAASENGYHCGCADDMDEDPPRAGEEPEDYEGPVDDGYESSDGVWRSSIYHEACARFDCTECGEDMVS